MHFDGLSMDDEMLSSILKMCTLDQKEIMQKIPYYKLGGSGFKAQLKGVHIKF